MLKKYLADFCGQKCAKSNEVPGSNRSETRSLSFLRERGEREEKIFHGRSDTNTQRKSLFLCLRCVLFLSNFAGKERKEKRKVLVALFCLSPPPTYNKQVFLKKRGRALRKGGGRGGEKSFMGVPQALTHKKNPSPSSFSPRKKKKREGQEDISVDRTRKGGILFCGDFFPHIFSAVQFAFWAAEMGKKECFFPNTPL